MMPTVWSVLFDGDRLSPEAGRLIRQSATMERFREEAARFW